ncbi:MAG: DUF3048 domain-containing protein [Candidatus Woykebacteria bacterium]
MQKFKSLSVRLKILVLALLTIYVGVWWLVGYAVGKKIAEGELKTPLGSLINEDIVPKLADFPHPINGVWYTQAEAKIWKNRLPLGVIIENHADSRPQTGLSRAEVVYEVLAEGGITRFLAVFLSQEADLGPVRSNRPYFLDWISEYSAGYAHVGGSPLAQSLVKKYKIKDLDQFFLGAPTYQRVSNRFAPHNVYTATKKLRGAAATRGYKGPIKISSWSFVDEEAKPEMRAKKFTLNLGFLGTFGYDVRWGYQPRSNNYLRFNGNAKHIDAATKKQLSTKNIIVQYVTIKPEGSGHGRILQETIGSGKAIVFRDGKAVSGAWKKKSRTERTRFFDKKGKEVSLNRGNIWVEVVPVGSPVTYK